MTPPLSDTPAEPRCEHGKTEGHIYPKSIVGRHPAYCPGPQREWHEYDCGPLYGDKPHWHPTEEAQL